jgi:DNA phosphorothioation-dependent restriction protein DptH
MTVTDNQAKYLARALTEIAGPGGLGDISFVRCIPNDLIATLVSHPVFRVPGWQVFAVTGESQNAAKTITADEAVEIREDKGPATLLIVDVSTAGAGMDGIYSAAKEISERELFKKAINHALRDSTKPIAELAKEAVARAKKLGQRHTVSPWREFAFYSKCAEKPTNIGIAIADLGLWPTVFFGPQPDIGEISKSALLVERLLLSPASAKTPSARVTALILQGETQAQRAALEKVLREAGGKALTEVLAEVASQPDIWLNNIKPSFATDKLTKIELVSWRNRSDKLTAWSGLHLPKGEDLPHLILDPGDDSSGLAVRWNPVPDALAKGSVNYEVTVVAASDVLATKNIDHGDRIPQKTFFSPEDFEELDESAKFQARVVVRAVDAPDVQAAESEDFIIVFGTLDQAGTYRGSGKTVRCAVEGAITLEDKNDLIALCRKRAEIAHFRTDSKGYIILRPSQKGRTFRIFRPPLIAEVEKKWKQRADTIGRWILQVRADGTRAGELKFQQIERGDSPEPEWARLLTASRLFCEDTMQGPGMLSRIYAYEESTLARAVEYLNAWEAALTKGIPALALAHTVEVQDLAGKTIGLIVLPSHPVRVAWQAAYDALAIHARYEYDIAPDKVSYYLNLLDSSHFPSMLPGLEAGTSFVFADSLGITAVAMVRDTDREPKAAVSTMALCLGAEIPEIAPSVGKQTSGVLAKEINSYLKFHNHNRLLQLHALRPGDASTVVRALGKVLYQPVSENGDEEVQSQLRDLAFNLNLYPSSAQQGVAGRFLTQLSQRRRSGSSGLEKEDAWILEPLPCGGNRSIPRLRWARRDYSPPQESAHLSLAFDTFISKVVANERAFEATPLHVFGLVASLERKFSFAGDIPVWEA